VSFLLRSTPAARGAAEFPLKVTGLAGTSLCRLLQRANRGAHLHLVGVAPGDLGVGDKISVRHRGTSVRICPDLADRDDPYEGVQRTDALGMITE
jgi:hypothetical protein